MKLKPKIASAITEIIASLQNAGFEAYIVGGAVRDFLLDRQPKDYDISTSATPEQIRRVFRHRRTMIIGRRFRLVHLFLGRDIIEISTFRRKPVHTRGETLPKKAADAPENMIFQDNEYGTAREDAERRDFTVNALFYDPVHDKIADFTGMGLKDIRHGIVRAIGMPKVRFEEDPVRILRAIKLVGQYGFEFDPETEKAVRECMPLIRLAADSRMTLELEKILKNSYSDKILSAFRRYGFLKYFLPRLDSEWNDSDFSYIMDLLRIKNERVRAGEYRESISLSMSILGLPLAERIFALGLKKKVDVTDILGDAISALLRPRFPTRRAISVAVRTLILQPKFDFPGQPALKDRFLENPGYPHARELACIRSRLNSRSAAFDQLWPKAEPRRFEPRRIPPQYRNRPSGRGNTPKTT